MIALMCLKTVIFNFTLNCMCRRAVNGIRMAMGSYYDEISVSLVGWAPVTTSHGGSLVIALLG